MEALQFCEWKAEMLSKPRLSLMVLNSQQQTHCFQELQILINATNSRQQK